MQTTEEIAKSIAWWRASAWFWDRIKYEDKQ